MRRAKLDRVWWLVSPGNPLKSVSELKPLAERMAACTRLARDPKMVVTAFEGALGNNYSADTLAFLRARYPGVIFYWIMGADNLAGFHRWKNWRRIGRDVPMLIVDRPGWRFKALASPAARALARQRRWEPRAASLDARKPADWVYLATRLSTLSSTALRKSTPTP